MKKNFNIRAMAMTGMLSAVAGVLMYLDFPLPIFPAFLKFDFSDLPALIGGFALGPTAGIIIELIKNLLHLLRTTTGGAGELANFLVGCALVLPAAIIYKKKKNVKGTMIGMGVGIISMAVAGAFANIYIIIPYFSNFMPLEKIIATCAEIIPAVNDMTSMILLTFVPFNLFKGIIISVLTFVVYKRVLPVLQGRPTGTGRK